jgi:hypothetical protein
VTGTYRRGTGSPRERRAGVVAVLFDAKVAVLAFASTSLIGSGVAANPGLVRANTYTVSLSGQAEVNIIRPSGGTGDMDGSGLVQLKIDPDKEQVCYDFTLSGISTPLMAHIHRAPAFREGPTVVTLFTGPGGALADCRPWTPNRLAEIVSDPANFYVSLYTTEYPDGALRGQLRISGG